MTDQAFLISRDVEKLSSILNLEKRPSGHLLLLTIMRQWSSLCPETVVSVQG